MEGSVVQPFQHLNCFLHRNIFQDVLHRDTLVKAFLDQVSVKRKIVIVNDVTHFSSNISYNACTLYVTS